MPKFPLPAVEIPEKPPAGRPPTPFGIRLSRFSSLLRVVAGCLACPRMESRRRVLSTLNGRVGVRVMFVAEAPGRNGADRTGVPLHGDPSGATFKNLLKAVGWDRADVFVTNAVLCNPRDDAGNNSTPTPEELQNCSHHLQDQIELVDPAVVVTVGGKALEAIGLMTPHAFTLQHHAASPQEIYLGGRTRTLFPIYHPSPRAAIHRPYKKQLEDFEGLLKLVTLQKLKTLVEVK